MKRFRKKFSGIQSYVSEDGEVSYPIRYYHCGEYGEIGNRPHYHALIFNFDFHDKVQVGTSNGFPIFTSPALEKLWGKGNVVIGAVTFESAGYCARYVMKKQLGGFKDDSQFIKQYRADAKLHDKDLYNYLRKHYIDTCPFTGELTFRAVEYSTMSRGRGIGKTWFDKFKEEVYPSDEVIVNGRKVRPPKYYDNLFKASFPNIFEDILFERFERGKKYTWNSTPSRLSIREQCKKAQISSLVRNVI